jgi:hypothetical protein
MEPIEDSQKTRLARKKIFSLAISLLALAAIVYFVSVIDRDSLLKTITNAPYWSWLLCFFGLILSHWLRAGRFRAEWKQSLEVNWRQAWGLVVRHSAWVILTPMRGGEALYVWALHTQGGISLKQASLSLLRLRLQDAWVLGILSLALFLPVSINLKLLFIVVVFGLTIWGVPLVWVALSSKLFSSIHPTGSNLHPPLLISWFYAISNWVIKGLAIGLPLSHMLPVEFMSALHGAAGGELAAILPLQPPAGIGVYEAGVIFGIQYESTLPWVEVAAAALAVHTIAFIVTIGSAVIAKIMGWSQAQLGPAHPAKHLPTKAP